MNINASLPVSPQALQTPSECQSGDCGESSEVAQAAAVKIFKQSTEAEPKAALDLLSKTLAPGVGTRVNITA